MNKVIKRILLSCILILPISYSILFFLPKPILLEPTAFSTAIYDDQHELLRLTLSKDEKFRLFTPLSEISSQLITGTLLQEDKYFRWHFGINPIALIKASWHTYALKSRRIGASTITMQLARIRYNIQSKKISGKLLQILKALQIEMHYSKDEILEAYLNLAPYGGNIEGVEAASLIYFGKHANKLSFPEALTLSIIPQNPGKRPNSPDLKEIRHTLLKTWLKEFPKDRSKIMAFDLPVVMQNIHHLPFAAPHFVNMVLNNRAEALPTQHINTTLNYKTQHVIERITKHYIARKRHLGIYNAAVLLVDTRDMGIKALMGSVNFFNRDIAGEINGADIKRSPGSTLKPLIYGLALDQGLIHPNTVLKDVPHSFSGYNPENFDYDFMGPIKAKDALTLSRNIPALDLAAQLVNPTLYQLLEQSHVSSLRSESYYGLSLNLGSVEMTMRELAGLYAMLLNEGIWYPIVSTQDHPNDKGTRLLSPEASFLVLDMLKGQTAASSLPVSWKTGTSSGYRDAWTIGSFGPYVLAVWVGNFDNKSNPSFIGKDIAAPLFFELIDAIKQERGPIAPLKKTMKLLNLKKIKVCSLSGMLPTRYCPNLEWTWFIPGKSPIKTDTIFREVAINVKTGLRTCHVDDATRFEVFEFWPSDVLKIFKKAGIQRHTPPLFEPGCAGKSNTAISPQITSPQAGIRYVMRTDSNHHDKIPLTAITDAGVAYVYWFVNDAFIGRTKPNHTLFWKAKPGHFIIRALDDHGLADAREISVEIRSIQ